VELDLALGGVGLEVGCGVVDRQSHLGAPSLAFRSPAVLPWYTLGPSVTRHLEVAALIVARRPGGVQRHDVAGCVTW
jgi:hypothetical protein